MSGPSLYRRIIAGQSGAWSAPLRGLLGWVSIPYAAAVARRNRRYDRIGPETVLPVPVLSVGNITVGGTGKTPLVIDLVQRIDRMGWAPAVVSRGYGVRPGEPNDEERLIRRHCPTVIYVADRDRVRGAKLAHRQGAKLIVLDDGFQHRRLGRTVDIVVIDATCPFGHGHLLPRGLLREPPDSLKRAHLVVVSRADQASPSQLADLEGQLKFFAPQAVHVRARHKITAVQRLDGAPPPSSLSGLRVVAFAAIGNPQAFLTTIRTLGVEVVGSRFWPDHHCYHAREINALTHTGRFDSCDLLLTTEKDMVKLAMLSGVDSSRIGVVRVAIDLVDDGDTILQDILNRCVRARADVRGDPGVMTQVDVLILGGGIAGLWTLDELHRRGYAAMLLEHRALGAGQTVCSQGIIHGGIKYTLSGLLSPSADAIREMPALWQACLRGRSEPSLTAVRILSPDCYLWRTASLSSRMGLMGAQVGLRTAAVPVGRDELPAGLRGCPGEVFRVAEPVLDVVSLLSALADRHRPRIRLATLTEVARSEKGKDAMRVTLRESLSESVAVVCPRLIVLTAGAGNAELRSRFGLGNDAMQRRPLHMVLVRGPLPPLFGHCVDGAKTRVTVTTNTDAAGRTVWHVGGELAEVGVKLEPADLLGLARRELAAVLPGIEWAKTQWASYRVDRAEARTKTGARPENPTVRRDGPVLTAWPTKLALAPRLATLIADEITAQIEPSGPFSQTDGWPAPEVAQPPWETCNSWHD